MGQIRCFKLTSKSIIPSGSALNTNIEANQSNVHFNICSFLLLGNVMSHIHCCQLPSFAPPGKNTKPHISIELFVKQLEC